MLKDITIGQYFPGKSFIHRLDPRGKILITILMVIIVFVVSSPAAYALYILFTALIIGVSKVKFRYFVKGLKPLLMILIFTAVLNMFMSGGRIIWQYGFLKLTYEGIILAVKMVLRLMLLVMVTTLLTFTTSPIMLTDGIERLLSPFRKIGVPAHELAMMMTIALRFIPTLIEETDKIMKAQAARLSGIDSGTLMQKAKSLIPLLIPLFVSAFRRADELAVAMESRCYRGGENRTRLHELKYTRIDLYALVYFLIFVTIIIVAQITM